MGKSSSSKKMTNVKFFIIVLIVSSIVTVLVASAASQEDLISTGLLLSVLFSFFLTLFRILKNSNDPDNRLGNWKYFFMMFIFITGIVWLGLLFTRRWDDVVPCFRKAIIVGLFIASVASIYRAIKPWHQKKKAEKSERERNLQRIEQLQNQNKQYADELQRKSRIISALQDRNSELKDELRTSGSSSSSSSNTSRYQNQYYAEQIERQREESRKHEEAEKKNRRLEDWYREYVTIEVSYDYHFIDREYNSDYWERRSEEIRVTRREAMALIQAGEKAVLGRSGYHDLGKIRNISYKVPYGLYNRPWNC